MARCPTCHRRLPELARCPTDGARTLAKIAGVPPDAPSLEGVRVERWIARGGFSDVWKGSSNQGELAIKIARGADRSTHARFQRESRALRRLAGAGAPMLALEGVLVDGRPFLAMEWVPHPTLAEWLARRDTPPALADVVLLGRAILDAVLRVLSQGVLHRDLKPENLMIAKSEERAVITLVDFGSAHHTDDPSARRRAPASGDVTTPGIVVGTEEYLAPERIRGSGGDERAEVYALGVILYELLTLRVPFSAGRSTLHAQVTLIPPRPSELVPTPERLESLLLDCLAKQPSARPPTIAALRERFSLDAIGSELRVPPSVVARARLGPSVEPAVLLLVRSVGDVSALSALVRDAAGFIARLRADEALCVFGAVTTQSALDAAISVALRWQAAEPRARTALHVANVTIRRTPDGAFSAYGRAIDEPGRWAGVDPTAPIAVTEPFAEAAGRERLDRLLGSAGARSEAPPSPALVGREGELALIRDTVRTFVASGRPACVLVEGGAGSGKSAFAKAMAELAEELGAGRVIGPLRASAHGRLTARDLLANLEGTPIEATTSFEETVRDRLVEALCSAARKQPLIVVLDDAHLAEDALLDALEGAALSSSSTPLCLLCAAAPALRRARTLWGQRISGFRSVSMGPLPTTSAKTLLRELLRPAEYVPDHALDRLCRAASDSPGALVQLAASVHRAGLVRARPNTASFYLETAELERLPAADLLTWAVTGELDALDPVLAEGAKVVALLGDVIDEEALRHVQRALIEAGAVQAADAGVLLEGLVESGLLRKLTEKPAAYAFRSGGLAAGVASLLSEPDRLRVHRAALEYHRSRAEPRLGAIALHAKALSQAAVVAEAERALAEQSARAQRLVDAEAHYTNALAFTTEAVARAGLLVGRAKMRSHLYRLDDAVSDLRAAIDAGRSADERTECAATLELATVLDWMHDYAGSAKAAEAALAWAEGAGDEALAAAAAVARGRTAWRRGAVEEAIESLSRGIRLATDAQDPEARTVGLLLLGCALVQAKRTAEAELCLGQAVDEAALRADRLHLCAGLGNRAFLWAEQGRVDRCIEDLTRAVRVARELGHPGTERTALLNLSEVLYWAGREDEASLHVAQARVLEERFLSRPIHSAVLLAARIATLEHDYRRALEHLDWLAARQLPEPHVQNAAAFVAALRHITAAAIAGGDGRAAPALDWAGIARAGETLLGEERLELQYFRAHYESLTRSDWIDAIEDDELRSHRVWGARLARLRARAPQAFGQTIERVGPSKR